MWHRLPAGEFAGWKPAPRWSGVECFECGEQDLEPNQFKPFDRMAAVQRGRRNLPHWEQDGVTYFVTYRVNDALPQSKLKEWSDLKTIWIRHHPVPWTEADRREYERRFLSRIQRWLDAGHGACALRDRDVGKIVEGTLMYFDGERYHLDEYVIMPNHVHLLVLPMKGMLLGDLLHSWKSYSALTINKRLGLQGSFWMDERFDRIVRSAHHLMRFRQYIRGNPVRARLRSNEYILGKGSGVRTDAD